LSTASIHWRSCGSGTTPVNASTGWPPTTAYTIGMPWTRNICASRWLLSTSTLASTHAPPPSRASFSRIGESCLHGWHHSAQKSMTTGVVSDRSSTSLWNVASVTSITMAPPPPPPPGGPPGAPCWAGASVRAGAGVGLRSALRSTAPRVKIDGVVRGSLMVP
jgi:hypothetical protein